MTLAPLDALGAAAHAWETDSRSPNVHPTAGALAAAVTDGSEAQRTHLGLIDQVLRDVAEGREDRVMIFMPPQVGKSRRVAEWGVLWLLLLRPDWRIAVASYAAGLARKRGRFVRNIIQGFPRLGLTLARDSKAADRWDLAGHRGGMITTGVGGGLTGEAVDGGIIDDPVKGREEADSEVIRDKTFDWYREVFETRLGPEGFVILMMTRWHEDDLAGRLLKEEGRKEDGGRWRVLVVPAIAEGHTQPLDPVTGAKTGTCACGRPDTEPHDPMGRPVGQPLPHPRLDPAEYLIRCRRTQKVSPRTYAALLQQRPTPDGGGLVSHDLLRTIRTLPDQAAEWRRRVVAIDPSGGGDDECGLVAGSLGQDKRAYVTHDRSAVMAAADWGRQACILANDTDADAFVVEKNYGGDQAGTIIAQAWDALTREGLVKGLRPKIVEVTAKRAKVVRAEPVAQAMREGRVALAGVFPELEEQWATYQQGQDSPDRLDASVYLILNLLPALPAMDGAVGRQTGRVFNGTPSARAARSLS